MTATGTCFVTDFLAMILPNLLDHPFKYRLVLAPRCHWMTGDFPRPAFQILGQPRSALEFSQQREAAAFELEDRPRAPVASAAHGPHPFNAPATKDRTGKAGAEGFESLHL